MSFGLNLLQFNQTAFLTSSFLFCRLVVRYKLQTVLRRSSVSKFAGKLLWSKRRLVAAVTVMASVSWTTTAIGNVSAKRDSLGTGTDHVSVS